MAFYCEENISESDCHLYYKNSNPRQTIDCSQMSAGLNCVSQGNILSELNSNELNVITLCNIELLNLFLKPRCAT